MVGILNLSEGSTIALHAVLHLAKGGGKTITTAEAADVMKVSAAHLSKIFQRLAKSGIVKPVRGPKGGYLLSRPLTEIRLFDVFEAIEGPLKLGRGAGAPQRCSVDGCQLPAMLDEINKQVVQRFEKKLSEL